MSVFVAVDTGGTFTDLAMFDAESNQVRYTKSLTTHRNPLEGIFDCVGKAGVELDRAVLFKHGTTLVINTLLERSGPAVALVTTKGFRDILEFGRGNRTEPFNLFYRRDPPLVPRPLRFELDERIASSGAVRVPPQRSEVEALARQIGEHDVKCVAISFLNSYVNPTNEKTVCLWLQQLLPDHYVTTGTDITREWYEFERTSTAVANAYVGPSIGRYVAQLDSWLKSEKFGGQFLMMGSNGGVLSVQHSAAAPVLLVESGPVGGCIGASAYGRQLGLDNIVAFDMGGTTAKCALVKSGEFGINSTYHVGGYGHGIPIRAPVLDIVEVGAGGGSIAWIDNQKRLNVGPKSAGSTPGPVAYGRGGTEPTVTDANLVLGRIDPRRFQGGEMLLDAEAARQAIDQRLAQPLGYHGEEQLRELASGILSIAAAKMSEAIKRITVQRGEDPRDFCLFAYGGGGPLHGGDLARELGIPTVVVPPQAGNFSAVGMLLSDIRNDGSLTFLRRLEDGAMAAVAGALAEIERDMKDKLSRDFGDVPVTCKRFAEMRYVGQYHSVRIPLSELDVATLRRSFELVYRHRYGHASETAAAEIVSLQCTISALTPQPNIQGLAGSLPAAAPQHVPTRKVYFPVSKSTLETKVFARDSLPIGFVAQGPAVIEEYGSTTLIGPWDRFEIGKLGEIRITISGEER
jgi:N-methylhydantoinase A